MSAPTVPVTAGTPADEVQVLGKVSYRWPITYAIFAAIALAYFMRGPESGDMSSFLLQNPRMESWVELPRWEVNSQLATSILGILLAVATAFAFWLATQRRSVPVWLHMIVGISFVGSFLVFASAGRPTVIPLTTLFATALALSVPLIFGAMSGLVCERSGIINIAIEGQLLFGAFAAAVVASLFAMPYLGLVAAPIAGALVGALLAWFSVMYRVNQIIVGVVLNTLVIGLTGFFFATVLSQNRETWNARQSIGEIRIPVLSEIPVLGEVLFNQSLLVYLMFAIVIVLQIALFRSRWGLRTRAVGEHPKAADTVGIAVNPRRVWNTILGGAIAGLGGAAFTVGVGLAFNREMSAGNGFIALAAMILGKWNPRGALMAALLFGFCKALGQQLSVSGSPIPSDVLLMLPYLITILAVAGFVGRVRPPAAEGIPYVK